MYQLQDLMGADVFKTSMFYASSLRLAPKNVLNECFEVDNILRTKTVDNEKYAFVKYQFYPKKFNQWVKLSDLNVKDN